MSMHTFLRYSAKGIPGYKLGGIFAFVSNIARDSPNRKRAFSSLDFTLGERFLRHFAVHRTLSNLRIPAAKVAKVFAAPSVPEFDFTSNVRRMRPAYALLIQQSAVGN